MSTVEVRKTCYCIHMKGTCLHCRYRAWVAALDAGEHPAESLPEMLDSREGRLSLVFDAERYGHHLSSCPCATQAHSASDCTCGLYHWIGLLRNALLDR